MVMKPGPGFFRGFEKPELHLRPGEKPASRLTELSERFFKHKAGVSRKRFIGIIHHIADEPGLAGTPMAPG
jgi:hypothetical protein